MDPTLTRSQAHKVFGELYRKSRSPEEQEEVDGIVATTSDVFVRIKRIEELDERSGNSTRNSAHASADGRSDARSGRGHSSSGGLSGAVGSVSSEKKARKKSDAGEAGGWLSRLFGGEIVKWGKANGTISPGFLGMSYALSPKVEHLFLGLKEDQIVASIKCLKIAIRDGWEAWTPAQYNVIVAMYNFLEEFVKVPPYLQKKSRPEEWILDTLTMQKNYVILNMHPNIDSVLKEDLPHFLISKPDLSPILSKLKAAIQYLLTLESRPPGIKNSVLAFYVLGRKKIVDWDTVVSELKVREPVLDRYRSPENVRKVIEAKIVKTREVYTRRKNELEEIDDIKTKYFQMDPSGKVKVDFLNEIVGDVVRKTYSESVVNEALLNAHKREPHRLLFVALKDFDTCTLPLLSGSITTKAIGTSTEVILFKQGMFNSLIDEFILLMREMELYIKKYKNVSYNFNDFMEDMKKGPSDEVIKSFIDIVRKSIKLFKNFLNDLRVVMNNHMLAKNTEASVGQKDKVNRTKEVPIENAAPGVRFLPHFDCELVSNNRMNGRTIEKIFEEIMMNVYNYLYIFRDMELTVKLSSAPRLQAEMESAKKELERMGVKL